MMKEICFFAICAGGAGVAGLLGIRKRNQLCLVVSVILLPTIVFTALWAEISLSNISLFLCITALLILAGLPGRIKG